MKHLHAMAFEMRDAVESGDLDDLGRMLQPRTRTRAHEPHIADGTPIEQLFGLARRAGALGGKICGAGGGGYLLLYCRAERQAEVRAALEAHGAQFADFAFRASGVEATKGSRTWRPVP